MRLAGPVTVADDKATVSCPALSTVGNNDGFLDPGESITCTACYSITQADLNNGSVTNTAKARAGGTDSNQDTATVTVTPPPPPASCRLRPRRRPSAIVAAASVIDLSITKTDRPDPVFVGETLTYTLTVRNAGPDTATNVRVADALPAATNFVSRDEQPGHVHRRARRPLQPRHHAERWPGGRDDRRAADRAGRTDQHGHGRR